MKKKNKNKKTINFFFVCRRFKNSIFCHACRGTQAKAPLYGCDYCSLSWHMDCIDPPISHPPNPASKWMCPSHADHFLVIALSHSLPFFLSHFNLFFISFLFPLQPKQRRKRRAQPEIEDEELPYRVEVEKEPPFQTVVLDGKQHILPERAVKIQFLERVIRFRKKHFPEFSL